MRTDVLFRRVVIRVGGKDLAIAIAFAEVEPVVDDRPWLKGFHEFVSARC